MCSVDPDEIVEMTRVTDEVDISSGSVMCRRCNTEKAVVVLRIKDAYCRECFLSYFVHKFRSTIGKSKQIRPGDRVLIGISGGLSSAALLHLVREGLDETSHKKLRFEPAFLYIDESCLSNDPDTGSQHINQVCSQVVALNFPIYTISLEQVMSTAHCTPVPFAKDEQKFDTNADLCKQLEELMSSCKSESAKKDLHEQLRREVFFQCASSLGYHKIFLGDNATTLAVCILANVAVGRGSQLADRVQFKARHKDIEVYRPMREILQNEVQYYIDLHNISTVQVPSLKQKGSSITSCTEDFVFGLQKEFPATIPTIFRTGDKLVSTSADISKCSTPDLNGFTNDDGLSDGMCAMCGLQLDTMQSEASAVNATFVSQKLSSICLSQETDAGSTSNGNSSSKHSTDIPVKSSDAGSSMESTANESSTNCNMQDSSKNACDCSKKNGCCSSSQSALRDLKASNELPKTILEKYLCYGCRIIVRELNEVRCLPIKVRGSVAEQERRKHIREQIQDFLL